MEKFDPPHIGITLPDSVPDELIERFKSDLIADNLKLDIRKLPLGPYASISWAIPTAIGIWFLKGYFDVFLKALGNHHLEKVRDFLKKQSKASRLIKSRVIVSAGSQDKIDSENTQSKNFSIGTRTDSGHTVKFLFDEKLPDADWDDAIDDIIRMLEQHFEMGNNDKLSNFLKDKMKGDVFAVLNSETKQWEFWDSRRLIEQQLDKKRNA